MSKERLTDLPKDPEPLRCQVAFKELSDEILKYKTNNRVTFFGFAVKVNPEELLARLRQNSLSDLILENGESFSIYDPTGHYPDLGLVMGETPPVAVSMTHWDWREKKWRIDPNGPKEVPYDITLYPGEFDWTREIDISILFGQKDNFVSHKLSVYEGSRSAGVVPSISRSIYAIQYTETGYEGHDHKYRRFRSQKEAMYFINLARELFEKRIGGR